MDLERPNVLLVEDNEADINLVEEALEDAQVNCNLNIVRDGLQAIEFMDSLDADPAQQRPDIVLLDLNLPKISGVAVLQRVRSSPKCSSSKVLIMSSSETPADRQHAMSLGATGYFRKPSQLDEFMALGPAIRKMLESC
jgi:CheY-like chemotaxis protein